MQIADDTVVTIDYRLTDDDGDLIDSSEEDGPMTYLQGHGNIVRGLERALAGKSVGDALDVVVPPRDGYGERSGGKPIRISRKELPADLEPEEGMGLATRDQNGRDLTLFVVAVTKDAVQLSLDHPLAGKNLHFSVTVRGVRAATEEELAHGHVHDGDGHHHHEHDHDHGHDHGHGHGGHHHH